LKFEDLPNAFNINLAALSRNPAFWPDRGDPDKNDRWLHSDYLAPSLPHVFNLYEDLVERGGLNQ